MIERPPHLEVSLTMLPSEHGGRSQHVFAGYRGQFYYDATDCDGELLISSPEGIAPGQTAEASYWFARPEVHLSMMRVGKAFLFREGNRVVGYGVITKIIAGHNV